MFELWKDDMSRVRLDGNSQASGFLGAVRIERTAWTEYTGVTYPYAVGTVNVPNDTALVMFGTTDGRTVAIDKITQGNGVKVLGLLADGRAGMWLYCFGARNVTTSNSGLQLLDESGVVTFDSQAKWLRLAGVVRSPVLNTAIPWPAGVATVAVGMSQQTNWLQQVMIGQNPSFILVNNGLLVSTASATVRGITRQGPLVNPPPPNTPRQPIGNLIFADVTRY